MNTVAGGDIPVRGVDDAVLGAPTSRTLGRSGEDFGLHFSRHATQRIEQRGMEIDATRMERLHRAVDQAEAKGSRDSLILLDELALVVSVQNRTVVTAVDEVSRKEHVFTNIDSVVIAP